MTKAEEVEEAARLGVDFEVLETCPDFLVHASKSRQTAAAAVQKLVRAEVVVTTYTVLREEVSFYSQQSPCCSFLHPKR